MPVVVDVPSPQLIVAEKSPIGSLPPATNVATEPLKTAPA
jgi:hypothetical protein